MRVYSGSAIRGEGRDVGGIGGVNGVSLCISVGISRLNGCQVAEQELEKRKTNLVDGFSLGALSIIDKSC